jgi:hypothetical protein
VTSFDAVFPSPPHSGRSFILHHENQMGGFEGVRFDPGPTLPATIISVLFHFSFQ